MSDKKRKLVHYQRNVYKTQQPKFKYGVNDGTATGIGGETRRKKIDEIVDDATMGRPRSR